MLGVTKQPIGVDYVIDIIINSDWLLGHAIIIRA